MKRDELPRMLHERSVGKRFTKIRPPIKCRKPSFPKSYHFIAARSHRGHHYNCKVYYGLNNRLVRRVGLHVTQNTYAKIQKGCYRNDILFR